MSTSTPTDIGTETTPSGLSGTWRRFQQNKRNTGVTQSVSGLPSEPVELWTLETGDNVMGTPVIKDGTIYAGSDDSNLYAINSATGEIQWQLDTDAAVNGSPTVFGETVYAGSEDGHLYAVRASSGEQEWRFDATVDSGEYSSPQVRTPPAIENGRVHFGDTAGRLFAVDAETGDEDWRFPTGGTLGIVTAPAIADNTIYVTSYDGSLYAIDTTDGTQVWQFQLETGAAWSAPTVTDDLVYAGANDGRLHAVDRSTGAEQWAYDTGGNVFSSPATDGDRVYVGGGDSVYALDASDGTHIWRNVTDGPVYSAPAVIDGTVYVGSYDNHVYALGAETGQIEWMHDIGATTVSGPAVVDDAVLVGDFSGDIHAIGTEDALSGAKTTPTVTPEQPTERPTTPTRWWSTWGYDAPNRNHNPVTDAVQTAAGIETVFDTGGYGPPTIVDGTGYVIGRSTAGAIDLDSGDRGWTIELATSRAARTPAVTSDSVYIHGTRLWAVDRASGEPRWTLGGDSDLYQVTAPTVVDGTIYIGRSVLNPEPGDRLGASGIYAVSAADGSRRWYFDDGATGYGALAWYDGSVYFGSSDDHVYALDAESGNERWSFETGHSILSAPAVADGTVYIGSLDNTLYALDAATGDEQWSVETFGAVRTTPALADGTVFAVSGGVSRTGHVYAIDSTSGSVEWTFTCKRPVPLYTPIVADDIVYVQLASDDGDVGTVYGLDASDGTIVTKVDGHPEGTMPYAPVAAGGELYVQLYDSETAGSGETETPTEAGDRRPTVRLARVTEGTGTDTTETCEEHFKSQPRATIEGPWPSEQHDAANSGQLDTQVGVIVVTTHSDGVYALDAADGSVRWSTDPISGIQSAPAIANGRVYFSINRTPYGIYALDAADGQRLWTARPGDCKTTPFVTEDTAYVGTSDQTVVALDASTGETRWQASGNRRLLSTPAVRNNSVYIGDEAGDIYALDTESGDRQWSTLVRTDDEIKTPVATGTDHVYATSIGGRLYALTLDGGDKKWEYTQLADYGLTGPVVADGQVFVADSDRLHAVNTGDGTNAWQFTPASGTPTAAAVDKESAYVGTNEGRLYCLDSTTSQERWQFETAAAVKATPILGQETVFVATDQGHIHAVDRDAGTKRWRSDALGNTDKMNVDGTLGAVANVEVSTDD